MTWGEAVDHRARRASFTAPHPDRAVGLCLDRPEAHVNPNRCPVCGCVVADDAQRCDACCTDLGDWDTTPSPLQAWLPVDSSGALWLDDLGTAQAGHPTGTAAPTPASARLDDAGTALPTTPARPAMFEPISIDVEVPAAPPLAVKQGANVPAPAAPSEEQLRSARKAARRAQVRRSRLHDAAARRGLATAGSEILVIDPDPLSREQLCALLVAFGFAVLAVEDPGSAPALAAPRSFVSIFVSMATATADGGDGIDLCQQLRGQGHHADAVVLVVARMRPVDRVRAELAGCDETILQPLTAGAVARVLDGHGIVLPSDLRRS